MSKTNLGLVEYVKSKIGTPYVYGAKMEVVTREMYNKLKSLYGHFVWDSDAEKIGRVCVDCSGLISAYTGVIRSSLQFKERAAEVHPIRTVSDAPIGALVWKAGHIGIYIGDGEYIAADGSACGTRKGNLPYIFTDWFLCNYIEYAQNVENTGQLQMEEKAVRITQKINDLGSAHGRPGTKIVPKGIVVHYVANPGSSALGNRNYFNSCGNASAHYIIDMSGEIIQAIPDNEVAWHAGRSFGPKWDAMSKTNNYRFIGIECCHPDTTGKFTEATRAALVELCVELCRRHGLNPQMDIYRHYDVCGKNCPLYYVNNPSQWERLKNDIIVEFAPKTAISYSIKGAPSVTLAQMRSWSQSKQASELFIGNAQIYYDYSLTAGVDPAISYAQSALETNFGNFGGVLDESYCNPCGMKNSDGGGDQEKEAHMRFVNWWAGIQAQIDHLALYAGIPGYPKDSTPDPRHFPFLRGAAVTVQALNGRWATDPNYAKSLTALIDSLVRQ